MKPPFIDCDPRDFRGKRKSGRDNKDSKTGNNKKFKKSSLPPIVTHPKTKLNDRSKSFYDGQKTYMTAEYTESSTTSWSNVSERRTFIDTFSFKSQSGRFKRQPLSADNSLCYKSVSVKSLLEENKEKCAKDQHDKKSNSSSSNSESLSNGGMSARKQKIHEQKFVSDSSSNLYY